MCEDNSIGRVSAFQAECCGFEPRSSLKLIMKSNLYKIKKDKSFFRLDFKGQIKLKKDEFALMTVNKKTSQGYNQCIFYYKNIFFTYTYQLEKDFIENFEIL